MPGAHAHEDLLDIGLARARHAADRVAVDRRVAPAEHGQAFFADDALEDAFADQALRVLDRQEDHADAVLARRRQGEAQLGAFAAKNLCGI